MYFPHGDGGNIGCVPFPTNASNLLAFSSKMADVAATSTDKRSVMLLTTYNTRSVHAVTHRAQQNLRYFTAIRPCFLQQIAENMDDNVSRSNITTIFEQFASNCCKRNRVIYSPNEESRSEKGSIPRVTPRFRSNFGGSPKINNREKILSPISLFCPTGGVQLHLRNRLVEWFLKKRFG